MEWWIETRLTNPLNAREHWSRRAKRAARQRSLVALTLFKALGTRSLEVPPTRAKHVTFTAYVGRGFDDDNLQAALKSIRDGLMEAHVIHGDGPRHGHVFEYEQRRGIPTAKQGVRVSVRLLDPDRSDAP
ncbi:MAG TPA: hypothetical protein VJ301_14525 [Propionibacteriaceae bacterium]|nr:hypothetical protein [Propionibacteriaceae bacterium]